MATDMAMFWKQTRADQRESLISLRLTWLITRLVNDFAGVSICPRKKALRVNELNFSLLWIKVANNLIWLRFGKKKTPAKVHLAKLAHSSPHQLYLISTLLLNNFKILMHGYFVMSTTKLGGAKLFWRMCKIITKM